MNVGTGERCDGSGAFDLRVRYPPDRLVRAEHGAANRDVRDGATALSSAPSVIGNVAAYERIERKDYR